MNFWDYEMESAPTDNRRILGLWHFDAPERDVVRIVWLAEKPHAELRYLCDALSEAPHYIQDPHAFCLIPEIKRPGNQSLFSKYLRTKAIIAETRMGSASVRLKKALLTHPMLDRIEKETNLKAIAVKLGFTRKDAKVVWEGFRATSRRKRSKE